MLSETEKEKVRKQAKEILGKFGKELDNVKDVKVSEEDYGNDGYREEGEGGIVNPDFRKRMFENAPEENGECIIAEKKKW